MNRIAIILAISLLADPCTAAPTVIPPTASGFVFESQSDVLHNGADNHKLKVFDPAIRGKSDQFSYRFRKPK
jgi:predicted methyltransferase